MTKAKAGIISCALTAIFLILFSCLSLRLAAGTFSIDSAGGIHTTFAGYGDIPLHLTQISKFAFEPRFNLGDPIFLGTNLAYPFMVNLASGLLLRVTGAWEFSVLAPIFILILANIGLTFLIYKKIFRDKGLAIAALLIFFLGSGLGGFTYLRQAVALRQSPASFVQNLISDNVSTVADFGAKYPDQNIDFGAPLTMAFTHQRASFLGLFGFLLFLWLLLRLEDPEKAPADEDCDETNCRPQARLKIYMIGAGVVLGLLPLWQTHGFVAAGMVLAVAMLLNIKKDGIARLKRLAVTALIGTVLALPQVYFLLSQKSILTGAGHFVAFRLGWMIRPGSGSVQFAAGASPSVFSTAFLDFIWLNFGFILPLFILSLATAAFLHWSRKKNTGNIIALFSISGLAIFLAVQTVEFQPWDFDDNKMLVYFLFLAAPLIVWSLSQIFHKRPSIRIAAVLITIVLLTFSGVIDLIPRLSGSVMQSPTIFGPDARQLAEFVKSHVTYDENVLTDNTFLNPVSSLAGRPVLEGYPGWLWTRGIDYSNRESQIRAFYSSPDPEAAILKTYHIAFVLVDSSAVNDFGASRAVFDKMFPKVFESGDFALYAVGPNI